MNIWIKKKIPKVKKKKTICKGWKLKKTDISEINQPNHIFPLTSNN
jgi:hypothetical protein